MITQGMEVCMLALLEADEMEIIAFVRQVLFKASVPIQRFAQHRRTCAQE
jgi:hypothetical protein